MYRAIDNDGFATLRHKFSNVCLLGMICLALMYLGTVAVGVPTAYASGPGGNVSDPVVRAVDIAKPAVVRIITQVVGQVTVNFSNGQKVTFPITPQNGFNGYPLGLSGTGAFISAHGDLLTADHVVNPIQDDKPTLDQSLDQQASQDVANYINQNLHPTQPATSNQVAQELTGGQLPSTTRYQKPQSQVYLSTDFSGPLSVTSFQDVPPSQLANVDKIEAHSITTQKDTAIIHVSGMDNMPMLQLGDSTTVQQQDQLTIVGFPGNADIGTSATDLLSSSLSHVSVSALKTTDTGAPLLQVDGTVQHGDSGGPALNSSGLVVGIVSFGVTDNSGSTNFLQASSSAKQLIQTAGVDPTPSLFEQAWSKAFTDYAATIPGHWHQSMREFQQIATQYPRFKSVTPFLNYATQQAQTEKQTQEAGSSTSTGGTPVAPVVGANGINPLFIVIGGVVVLIVLVGGVAISRRRKPVVAAAPGYGAPPASGYNNMPGQSYGAGQPPASQVIPQTPGYPGQPAYQQPQQRYGSVPGQPVPSAASAPQPAYRPQPVQPAQSMQQQSYRPPQQPVAGGMSSFGAPVPVTPPTSSASDSTLVARPGKSVPQWRSWPCGHINRDDARFCGTCGEAAPPASIGRRVEQ